MDKFLNNIDLQNSIKDWDRKLSRSIHCHYESAKHLANKHYGLGIPTIICVTIASTGIFAASTNKIDNNSWIGIASGLFGIVSAILSALQTFSKYSERASKHQQNASEFSSLKRELDLLVSFPPKEEEIDATFKKFLEKYNNVSKQSEYIHPKIWDKCKDNYSKQKFQSEYFKKISSSN